MPYIYKTLYNAVYKNHYLIKRVSLNDVLFCFPRRMWRRIAGHKIIFLFGSHCILESWLQIYLQKSNIDLRCHVNLICITHNFSNYNPINSALLMSLHMRTSSPVATQKLHQTFGSSVLIYPHDVFIRCVFFSND